jgi:hypothetical protein
MMTKFKTLTAETQRTAAKKNFFVSVFFAFPLRLCVSAVVFRI